VSREREEDGERDQEGEADALEDVHPQDPAGLAEDRKPHPVHQGADEEDLGEAAQRPAHAPAAGGGGSGGEGGADLGEGHGEAGGENEGGGDQAVDPLEGGEEGARTELGAEQGQTMRLDHQDDGEAAEPVDGPDAESGLTS